MQTTLAYPPAATVEMPKTGVKTVTWPTNYNNKLSCNGFIHVDLAPARLPVRSQAEQAIIVITTLDHSHPPVRVQLFDMLLLPLNRIPCYITLASHGMDEMQFADYMLTRHPQKITLTTTLAVYYYKEIPPT